MYKHFIIILLTTIYGCASTSTGSLVKSSNPLEAFIDVYGNIDKDSIYKIDVEYRATATSRECTYYHFALGSRAPKKHSFTYYPNINDGYHSIRIPLQELDQNSSCKWKPALAFILINYTNPNTLGGISAFSFERGVQSVDPVVAIECTASTFVFCSSKSKAEINEFNKKYRLDLKTNKI